MRKFLSALLLFSITLVAGCSNFPDKYPLLNVEYDAKSFITTVNSATWINGKDGGSSDLGYWDLEVAKDIKPIQVKAESVLKLNLDYTKDINSFRVRLVDGSTIDNPKFTEINIKNYEMTAPKQKGEYIYSVQAAWDEKHGVGYLFKISVE